MPMDIEQSCFDDVLARYGVRIEEYRIWQKQVEARGHEPLFFGKTALYQKMRAEMLACVDRRTTLRYGMWAGVFLVAAAWKTQRMVRKEREAIEKAQRTVAPGTNRD